MSRMRKIVLLVSGLLPACWIWIHAERVIGDADGTIRLVLGFVFAALILVRRKPAGTAREAPPWLVPTVAVAGVMLALIGIVFEVRQFEWLGLVAICYACLRWSLPATAGRDVFLAMFVVYWIHPVPWALLGRLQLTMQQLSIGGAEWALHVLNQRVWADGLFLHSGYRVFGVPESCSGMRTLVTVSMCSLGVGLLMRFRWYELAVFLLVGFVQVIFLNVLRIALMVYYAERMPVEWGDTFLHDTLGVFLLVAVTLMQLEASWYRVWTSRRRVLREGIKRGELERPDKASVLPRVWRLTLRWGGTAALIVGLLLSVLFVAYKRRPDHRVAMIAGLVDDLMDRDVETAERAVRTALALAPDNRSLQSKLMHIEVIRGKYDEALAICARIPEPLSTAETVIKSWALMGVHRPTEAIALLDALPPSQLDLPGVAVVRAEYGALRDEPETVARNVVKAAPLHAVIERVRALFPYLARHEQWQAIVKADRDLPYASIAPAVVSVHAHLRVNDINGAAEAMKLALKRWPDDPVFLRSLYALALARPEGPWEQLFVNTLHKGVGTLKADDLSTYIGYCFQLNRPDLAWAVYLRLRRLDPRDPALFMTPAQWGDAWLRFRRHQLGVKGAGAGDLIDMRPIVRTLGNVFPLSTVVPRIPLAADLLKVGLDATRGRFLNEAVTELQRRELAGEMNRRMEMTFPTALAMEGQYDKAHARLDMLAERYPEQRRALRIEHALFYNRQGNWGRLYETLREHYEEKGPSDLRTDLLMVNACMNLRFAVIGMLTAQRARATYPGSSQVEMAVAAIWDVFNFKEEALGVLDRAGLLSESPSTVQIMYDTGRFLEAERLAKAHGIRLAGSKVDRKQALSLMPAEATIQRLWPPPLSDEERRTEAERIRGDTSTKECPFGEALDARTIAWYEQGDAGASSDPAAWEALGRDAGEKAVALHRLAVMLGRQRDYAGATAAARRAVAHLPESAILWRLLAALTEGDPEVVHDGAAHRPDDPDLWLASLVIDLPKEDGDKWALEAVQRAIASERFSVGTLVRAGDFLLSRGMRTAAVEVAKYVVPHCRGLLAAHAFALRCALAVGDLDWALTAALNAVDNAVDPVPFYRVVVAIKTRRRSTDGDMVAALEYLKEHLPKQTEWGEHLADVYFQKRDAKRALTLLAPIIEADMTGVRLHSLLVAAESARVQGDLARSIAILEQTYSLYPDKLSVLNNLVYNLAQSKDTVDKAKTLLPKLLAQGSESFSVLDTAANVYLRGGDLQTARRYADRAMDMIQDNTYSAPEVRLNAAEIYYRTGDTNRARALAVGLQRSPDCPAYIETSVRALIRRIDAHDTDADKQ